MSFGKKPVWPWWNGLWTGIFIGLLIGALFVHSGWLNDPIVSAFGLPITAVGMFVAWLPDMVIEICQQVRRYRDAAKP